MPRHYGLPTASYFVNFILYALLIFILVVWLPPAVPIIPISVNQLLRDLKEENTSLKSGLVVVVDHKNNLYTLNLNRNTVSINTDNKQQLDFTSQNLYLTKTELKPTIDASFPHGIQIHNYRLNLKLPKKFWLTDDTFEFTPTTSCHLKNDNEVVRASILDLLESGNGNLISSSKSDFFATCKHNKIFSLFPCDKGCHSQCLKDICIDMEEGYKHTIGIGVDNKTAYYVCEANVSVLKECNEGVYDRDRRKCILKSLRKVESTEPDSSNQFFNSFLSLSIQDATFDAPTTNSNRRLFLRYSRKYFSFCIGELGLDSAMKPVKLKLCVAGSATPLEIDLTNIDNLGRFAQVDPSVYANGRCETVSLTNVSPTSNVDLYKPFSGWTERMPQLPLVAGILNSLYAISKDDLIVPAPTGKLFNPTEMTFVNAVHSSGDEDLAPLADKPYSYYNVRTQSEHQCMSVESQAKLKDAILNPRLRTLESTFFDPVTRLCTSALNKCNGFKSVELIDQLPDFSFACVGPFSIQQVERRLTPDPQTTPIEVAPECAQFRNLFRDSNQYKPAELLYTNEFSCRYDPFKNSVAPSATKTPCVENESMNPLTQSCRQGCEFSARAFPRHPFLLSTCHDDTPFVFCPSENYVLKTESRDRFNAFKCSPDLSKLPFDQHLADVSNSGFYFDKRSGDHKKCPAGQVFFGGDCVPFSGGITYIVSN